MAKDGLKRRNKNDFSKCTYFHRSISIYVFLSLQKSTFMPGSELSSDLSLASGKEECATTSFAIDIK